MAHGVEGSAARRNQEDQGVSIVPYLLPLVLGPVLASVLWPDVVAVVWVAQVGVLIGGAFLAAVAGANLAGEKRFSLPCLNLALVVVVGATLAIWFGWKSTGIVLAFHIVVSLGAGWFSREC